MARVLRPVGHAILGSVAVIVAIAGVTVVRMDWFDDKPYFEWSGDQTFTCYRYHVPRHPTLLISFSNDKLHAVIRFPDRDVITSFERGGLAGDVYQGDGIELILDPEAYVTGYKDQRIGPCQRD